MGQVTVEVVEVDETADGWRYLVEDQLELLPEVAAAGAQPVRRNEWFFDTDGSIRRGDVWVDGVLGVDLKKPIRVFQGQRFGHLGWPKPVKRRGRLALLLREPGSGPPLTELEVRLGDRSHPTIRASYDGRNLGRMRWTDRFGLRHELVSAVIDGVEWEAPFRTAPFTPGP